MQAGDVISDASATDNDTFTVAATDDVAAGITTVGVENVVFNLTRNNHKHRCGGHV